ncbi:Arginase/deacetylase [Ceratobasidium sp. AG-I]|nr:Arginase/deacetylase [Ceratobasidium sp. AG-I]
MNKPPKLSIHIQPACAEHRYIRDKDLSSIVERPERLRALGVGIAASIALAELAAASKELTTDSLVDSLNNLDLESKEATQGKSSVVQISRHPAPDDASFLANPAVRTVHALEEDTSASSTGEEYLSQLAGWVSAAEGRIKGGESEIPEGEGLSQGDLYLSPKTLLAIAGALQTTCLAVDSVVTSGSPRVFVAVRPPGHHCGSDEPAGFCWVNNVMVGAAHAYHAHGVNRVVIFDIDLHHGNGTQSIAWKINAQTHRESLERAARRAAGQEEFSSDQEGLQIYYGSLHDVLSYPCEDGDPTLTAAASVSLHGNAHGQHIENVHLQEWADEADFFERLYGDREGGGYAGRLFGRARAFLKGTGAAPEKTMIFVSCGFDAGEHEYESMSRHNRRVPTTFYNRFAHDTRLFADVVAQGRVVGVLEGGYSDRALVGGGIAWVAGMLEIEDKEWWSVGNLEKLEAAALNTKRKPRLSATPAPTHEPWIARVLALLPTLDATFGVIPTPAPRSRKKVDPPVGVKMTLRERGKKAKDSSEADDPPPGSSKATKSAPTSPAKKPRSVSSKSSRPTSPSKVPASTAPPVPPIDQILLVPPTSAAQQPLGPTTLIGNSSPGVDEAANALESLSLNREQSSGIGQNEAGTGTGAAMVTGVGVGVGAPASQAGRGPLVVKIRRPKNAQPGQAE